VKKKVKKLQEKEIKGMVLMLKKTKKILTLQLAMIMRKEN
jgi:hypothetical protein